MKAQHQESGVIPYVQKELALALKEQMTDLLRSCAEGEPEISAACVANMYDLLACLAPSADEEFNCWLKDSMYTCQVIFTGQGIDLGIYRRQGWEDSDFAVLEDKRKRQKAFAQMDHEVKSFLDGVKPVRFAPSLSDFLEQSAVLCHSKLSGWRGNAGQMQLDKQDLHMLMMSALYAAGYMQNHNARHLIQELPGQDTRTKLETRYKTWKDEVKRFLLCCMTAGAVERGEARLSVSYAELLRHQP